MIFQHARIHAAEHERQVEEDEERREKPKRDSDSKKADGKEVWSEKTQDIRNKLNKRKRKSKDRWNRFAGTSGAGARGR